MYTQALLMKQEDNDLSDFVPRNQGGHQKSSGGRRSFDTNNQSVQYWTRAVTKYFTQEERKQLRERIISVWLEDTLLPKQDEYLNPIDYLLRRGQRFSCLLDRVFDPNKRTRRKRGKEKKETTLKQKREVAKEWEK